MAHQANSRILDHAAERLGVASERIYSNIERYGNTSSASIPLALTEARDDGRLRPGDLLLLVGFGGGPHLGLDDRPIRTRERGAVA